MHIRSLVAAAALLVVFGCRDQELPLQPPTSLATADFTASNVLSPGTPVNLSQNPAFQTRADVSGDIVVWRDKRDDSNGDLWGCDISGGLGACSSTAVRLAADMRTGDSHAPSISGNTVVWTNSAEKLVGCDISAGASTGPDQDECSTASELAASANAQLHPEVSDELLVWLEASAVTGVHIYACSITGGLNNCSSSVEQVDPAGSDLGGGNTGPVTNGSIIVWHTGSDGSGRSIVGCDASGGLATCSDNVITLGASQAEGGFSPAISGNAVVWMNSADSPDHDIMGCDISSGLPSCTPTNLTDPLGQSEAEPDVDGNVVVWTARLGDEGIFACDISGGLSSCPTTAIRVSGELTSSGGVRDWAAVDGSTVVWHQDFPEANDGLGDAEIMGANLGTGNGGEGDFPSVFASFDTDSDGVADATDNCPQPEAPNKDQRDTDEDGLGDLCDGGALEIDLNTSWVKFALEFFEAAAVVDRCIATNAEFADATKSNKALEELMTRELQESKNNCLRDAVSEIGDVTRAAIRLPGVSLGGPIPTNTIEGVKQLAEEAIVTFKALKERLFPSSPEPSDLIILSEYVKTFSVVASPEVLYREFYVLGDVGFTGSDWQVLEVGDAITTNEFPIDFGFTVANITVEAIEPTDTGARVLFSIWGIAREPDLVPPVISHTPLEPELLVGSTPLVFEYSAHDRGIGLAEVNATLDGVFLESGSVLGFDEVGDHLIRIRARDYARNVAVVELPYTVLLRVDIQPGQEMSSWQCGNRNGLLPVAILSMSTFDASAIDPATVGFGKTGSEAEEFHRTKNGRPMHHVEDVNGDGRLDLVMHFQFGDTGFSCDDVGTSGSTVTIGTLRADVDGLLRGSDQFTVLQRP